ncbi:MAG TPA: hypothetical protein VFQ53_19690 [Kofleriaceae bacterium]|nr:hypothetical protein [Kofleriaceae bacterium]
MKYLLLGFAFTLAAACNKGADVDGLAKLKDEACACKDKACGDAVNKKLDDAIEQMAKDMGGKDPDEATQKKIMSIMTDAGLCIAKLDK